MHFKICELNIQLVILVNITAMFRTYRTYLAHLGIYTLRQDTLCFTSINKGNTLTPQVLNKTDYTLCKQGLSA